MGVKCDRCETGRSLSQCGGSPAATDRSQGASGGLCEAVCDLYRKRVKQTHLIMTRSECKYAANLTKNHR